MTARPYSVEKPFVNMSEHDTLASIKADLPHRCGSINEGSRADALHVAQYLSHHL
jgi:hypothetical protein